jgi:hypothetical protein
MFPCHYEKTGVQGLPLPQSMITYSGALKVLTQLQPQHEVASIDHHFLCINKPITTYPKAYTT